MTLRVGKPAPETTVEAYVRGEPQPQPISLPTLQGQWVVLFFYPRDFTFVCPTEIAAFGELAGEFSDRGCVVCGASTNTEFVHLN